MSIENFEILPRAINIDSAQSEVPVYPDSPDADVWNIDTIGTVSLAILAGLALVIIKGKHNN